MRKSKEHKRTRRLAAAAYRRGEKAEAYKGWAEAAKGYRQRREAKQAKKKKKEG
jgi:hypothetical protein